MDPSKRLTIIHNVDKKTHTSKLKGTNRRLASENSTFVLNSKPTILDVEGMPRHLKCLEAPRYSDKRLHHTLPVQSP